MGHQQKPSLLEAKVLDSIDIVQKKRDARFSSFLNEGEIWRVKNMPRVKASTSILFYGGYADATRQMIGIFPEWQLPDEKAFPIAALTIHFRAQDDLTHRDVLGALLSLNITRDAIGDILFLPGQASVLLRQTVIAVVENELAKIGRVGVRVTAGAEVSSFPKQQFKEIKGTVPSVRLDAMVSFFTGLSRNRAAEHISGGLVQVNGQAVQSGKVNVTPKNVLSIRGYGKFIFEDVLYTNKKGRLFIYAKQFI